MKLEELEQLIKNLSLRRIAELLPDELSQAKKRNLSYETVLLRLARGSGVYGLAAIRPVRESADLRMLRPCLAVPRERLCATLRQRKQAWIEDPSNVDARDARVRIRKQDGRAVCAGYTKRHAGLCTY